MACVDHTICPHFIHAGRNAHFRCLVCLSEGIICVDLLRHGLSTCVTVCPAVLQHTDMNSAFPDISTRTHSSSSFLHRGCLLFSCCCTKVSAALSRRIFFFKDFILLKTKPVGVFCSTEGKTWVNQGSGSDFLPVSSTGLRALCLCFSSGFLAWSKFISSNRLWDLMLRGGWVQDQPGCKRWPLFVLLTCTLFLWSTVLDIVVFSEHLAHSFVPTLRLHSRFSGGGFQLHVKISSAVSLSLFHTSVSAREELVCVQVVPQIFVDTEDDINNQQRQTKPEDRGKKIRRIRRVKGCHLTF